MMVSGHGVATWYTAHPTAETAVPRFGISHNDPAGAFCKNGGETPPSEADKAQGLF